MYAAIACENARAVSACSVKSGVTCRVSGMEQALCACTETHHVSLQELRRRSLPRRVLRLLPRLRVLQALGEALRQHGEPADFEAGLERGDGGRELAHRERLLRLLAPLGRGRLLVHLSLESI